MKERIEQELNLLRQHYEEVDYRSDGRWVKVWPVVTGPGWSQDSVAVAFQIPTAFPGTPPYGFYVHSDLTHGGAQPKRYRSPAPTQPPFEGDWGMFSWTQDGSWRATSDVVTGSNLYNWTRSFQDRFGEGG